MFLVVLEIEKILPASRLANLQYEREFSFYSQDARGAVPESMVLIVNG